MDRMIRDARVLVVVKAYPNPSKAHRETVCTAGLLDGRQWVRIYPVPYRMLADDSQYPKYAWIRVDIERRIQDFRPESYHLQLHHDEDTIKVESKISAGLDGWKARKRFVLQQVYDSLEELIARAKGPEHTSIGVIKPREILDAIAEPTTRDWDPETIATLQEPDLFESAAHLRKLVRKVPYRFMYYFRTADGKDRTITVEDWEIGALYWNCLREHHDETTAVTKVKERLMALATTTDLHFIMGTYLERHMQSASPFGIIGLFYPPFDQQPELPGLFDL